MWNADDTKGSVLDRVKAKARDVQDGVLDKLSEVSEVGQERIKDAVEMVNELLPVVLECGYSVEGIDVSIGLVPEITIEIGGLNTTIEEAKYQQILETHKERKMLLGVIRALQTTSKIRFLQMRADRGKITLGLPPKISLKFSQDE